jgi:DNA segregation ATPase FtsK/SpoIIIE, S-DNA-T family
MGRKRKYRNQTKTVKNDFFGGILIVASLILFVFITFDNIGSMSNVVNTILRGLFGITIYIMPVILLLIGVYVIVSDKKIKTKSEIFKGLVVMCSISSVIYIFNYDNFKMFDNIFKYLTDIFNSNSLSGIVGGVISNIFVKLIGVLPSKILLIFASLISALYFINISLKQFIYALYNIFVYIVNTIYSICQTVFRKDETKLNKLELRRREKLNEKMMEKRSEDVEKNINLKHEQLEFNIDKLDDNVEAKQQRDDFFKKQLEKKEDNRVKEVLTLDHVKHVAVDNYVFPPIELLGINKDKDKNYDKKAIHATAVNLQKTLASFGVDAKVINITHGPTVTRYELAPNTGVKVSKIVNLADDIALNLAAKSIRIEAPIPGKAAVGIEVPNASPESVFLREVIESKEFKSNDSKLAYSLGKDAAGEIIIGDVAKMPHMLVAGATGSGKSVCINSIIVSLLYKSKPSEVKLILVDPKMVELSGYNGIPHLLIPVVTDPKKAAGALNWAVQEMVNRYNLFASKGVKDIKGYNSLKDETVAKLPQIVIIIDELADLMMVAPNDVEDAICRLAQMARAAGMHLVIATQRPSVDVITGIIKANIPSRIAFTVSSQIDSRTILDSAGAEKLLGKGDMLYYPVGATKPQRIQGTYISEKEIEKIVETIKKDSEAEYSDDIIESIEKSKVGKDKKNIDSEEEDNDSDMLLNDAIDMVVDMGQASASMLQRRFKIGYSRAGRIVDQMEARGLISGYDGSKPRQLLITKEEWQEIKFSMNKEKNEKSE